MAQLLRRPSVTVAQVVRRPVPVTAQPTLVPAVVGPCRQVVPATQSTASGGSQINAQAKVIQPATAQAIDASGDPPVYSLNAKSSLVFSITNGLSVDVRFPTTDDYTPGSVVARVLAALAEVEETGALAEVVGKTPITGVSWRIRTFGRDESTNINIDPDGRSAAQVVGSVDLTTLAFPADVAGKTIEVSVDEGAPQTITLVSPADPAALVAAISALVGATAGEDAGNHLTITSDLVGSPSNIRIVGGTLLATVGLTVDQVDAGTGSTADALTAFGFDTTDIFFGASTYAGHELVIPPSAQPDPRDNIDSLVFDVTSMRAFLSSTGGSTLREILRKTALLRKATAAVSVIDDGNGDNKSPFVSIAGQNFSTPVAAVAVVTAAGAPNFGLLSNKSVIMGDDTAPRTVNFGTVATIGDVVSAINAVFNVNDGLLASSSGGNLRITSTRLREDGTTLRKGEDSQIVFYGGNGLAYLDTGVSPVIKAGRTSGDPHKAAVADQLYVDGVLVGKIIQVAPSGVATRLKLDKQLPLTFTGTNFYIVAQNLKAITDGGPVDRPAPDLIVESDGQMVIKAGVLRDTQGKVVESVVSNVLYPGRAALYCSYSALRLDVTGQAEQGLVSIGDSSLIEALLEPVDERNPLALGLYFAKLNAPGINVVGLGIDEVSVDFPDGTIEAYTRAASYLEQFEVYGIALLSQEDAVARVMKAHVDLMSAPERKRERVLLFNAKKPTHRLDTLVGSGAGGNTQGPGPTYTSFDTGIADLGQMLLEQGIDPNSAIAATTGLYLDLGSDSKHYSISAVSGSLVTVRTTFAPGQNDDSFYSTDAIPEVLIDVSFGLRVRGAALTLSNGLPDKDAISDTYMEMGQSFSDKRVWLTMPDKCAALVGGIEKTLSGAYLNAGIAGMIANQSPSQSFTNLGMVGFTRTIGSQGALTEDQLDHIAYGGVYILCQDGANLPVIARQALTTDRSSLESQTDTVVKSLDFVAKYQRQSLKNFIGKTNVRQGTIDSCNTVLQATIQFLTDNDIVQDIKVDSFTVDPERKDGLKLDETVIPFYPTNSIAITLFV